MPNKKHMDTYEKKVEIQSMTDDIKREIGADRLNIYITHSGIKFIMTKEKHYRKLTLENDYISKYKLQCLVSEIKTTLVIS